MPRTLKGRPRRAAPASEAKPAEEAKRSQVAQSLHRSGDEVRWKLLEERLAPAPLDTRFLVFRIEDFKMTELQ